MKKLNLCLVRLSKASLCTAILFLSFAFVPTIAAQCGNDIIDSGEECDDGNTLNGDCCDASCNFEYFGTPCGNPSYTECTNPDICTGDGYCSPQHFPGGTPCTDDSNICTDDECSGSGICFHINNTFLCDDGLYCNGTDSCSDGTCSVHTGDPCAPLFCDEGFDVCESDTMCKGNFDYDQDVDGSDAHTFKQHFGRHQYLNPCPPDGPAPVEKTWQTTSYATGDDGDLEEGVIWPNPRFTDNGDGTVTDNLTGLIWLKHANCFGNTTWDNALSACNGLADGDNVCLGGGFSLTDGSQAGDWRLPNYKELFSIVDAENIDPPLPIGHPFTNVQPWSYWSSTAYSGPTNDAWVISMVYGSVNFKDMGSLHHFWPVRGGHSGSVTTTTTVSCLQQGEECIVSSECCDGCCCNAPGLNVCTTTEQCGFLGGGCD